MNPCQQPAASPCAGQSLTAREVEAWWRVAMPGWDGAAPVMRDAGGLTLAPENWRAIRSRKLQHQRLVLAARALGCAASYLLEGDDPPPRPRG